MPVCKGMVIAFEDGSGEGHVAFVRQRLRSFSPGVHLPRVSVHFDSEPAERLVAAEAAGWRPVQDT